LENKMNCYSLHSYNCQAKQAGFMPTYWFAVEISNDRTPELGSRRTVV